LKEFKHFENLLFCQRKKTVFICLPKEFPKNSFGGTIQANRLIMNCWRSKNKNDYHIASCAWRSSVRWPFESEGHRLRVMLLCKVAVSPIRPQAIAWPKWPSEFSISLWFPLKLQVGCRSRKLALAQCLASGLN